MTVFWEEYGQRRSFPFPKTIQYVLYGSLWYCSYFCSFVLCFFKICPLDKCITKEHNTNHCSSRPFSNHNLIDTLNNILNRGPAFTTLELSLRGQRSLCSLCYANIRFNVIYFFNPTLSFPTPLNGVLRNIHFLKRESYRDSIYIYNQKWVSST